MNSNIFSKIKKTYIYIVSFLFWVYIFYMVPPVCDRWMENITYKKVESIWAYLWTQLIWIKTANARVLSNLFSFFIDWNNIISAVVSAIMLVMCSYLMVKIVKYKEESIVLQLFSCGIMILVSYGIRKEVYFYAKTLYISAYLLLLLIIYLLFIKEIKLEKEKKILCVVLFIASTWIENLSVTVFATVLFYFLYRLFIEKKISFVNVKYLLCSALGLAIMLCSALLGKEGRLNTGIAEKIIESYEIREVFDKVVIDNRILYFIMFGLCAIWIFKVYLKKKKKILLLFLIYSISLTIIFGIMNLNKVYQIICAGLSDMEYGKRILGWYAPSEKIGYLYERFIGPIYVIMPFLIAIFLCIFIAFVARGSRRKIIYMVFLWAIVSNIIVTFVSGEIGNRILANSVFLICGINLLILTEILEYESKKDSKILFITGLLFILVRGFDYNIDVNIVRSIENERIEIADEVRVRQKMGEWNYNDTVYFPEYTEKVGQEILIGGNRLNPSQNDIYYDVFLEHYGLDKRTKVEFQ